MTITISSNFRIIVAIIDAFHFNIFFQEDDNGGWEPVRHAKNPSENLKVQSTQQVGDKEEPTDEAVVEGEVGDKKIAALTGVPSSSIRHNVFEQLLSRLKDCATAKVDVD